MEATLETPNCDFEYSSNIFNANNEHLIKLNSADSSNKISKELSLWML